MGKTHDAQARTSAKRETLAAVLAAAGYAYQAGTIVSPQLADGAVTATAQLTATAEADVANKLAKGLQALGWTVQSATTALVLERAVTAPATPGHTRQQLRAALQEAADADL